MAMKLIDYAGVTGYAGEVKRLFVIAAAMFLLVGWANAQSSMSGGGTVVAGSSPIFATVNVTNGYQVNGVALASTNLSDSTALAYLGNAETFTAQQTFPTGTACSTGGFNFTGQGSTTFMYAPSATAFGLCISNVITHEFLASGFLEVGQTGGYVWGSGNAGSAKDTGLTRDAAGVVDCGTGAQGNKACVFQSKRYTVDGGTTLVAGDFVLSAGWGTTASTAITLATSKDAAAVITVTSSGTGQAANPTIAFTFHDGTWTNTPVCIAIQTGGTGIFGDSTVSARSATAQTWVWNATPAAAATYEFSIHCMGS